MTKIRFEGSVPDEIPRDELPWLRDDLLELVSEHLGAKFIQIKANVGYGQFRIINLEAQREEEEQKRQEAAEGSVKVEKARRATEGIDFITERFGNEIIDFITERMLHYMGEETERLNLPELHKLKARIDALITAAEKEKP